MTINDIYNLSVQRGIDADPRGRERVEKNLERKWKKFEKLSDIEKEGFDKESLTNPYSDTRILHIADNKEIKKVLVGIDIDTPELLLAKDFGDIDLAISHHPHGRAFADMHEVMDVQADVFNTYGVPINIGEAVMRERIEEVYRGINPRNTYRTIDAAKLLGMNLMCLHTVADNEAANFLKQKLSSDGIERLEDVMKALREVEEYKEAIRLGVGPGIFVGKPDNRCGKIFVGMTGGTDGTPKIYEKLAQAGIGTVVDMHVSEEHKKEAEAANLNVVNTGHMSSDSIGMNLILDELEKQDIEIVSCSGLIRFSRLTGGQALAGK